MVFFLVRQLLARSLGDTRSGQWVGGWVGGGEVGGWGGGGCVGAANLEMKSKYVYLKIVRDGTRNQKIIYLKREWANR